MTAAPAVAPADAAADPAPGHGPLPVLALLVNGHEHRLALDPRAPLLSVLRQDLALNGPKYGCGLGECGACTVLVDGRAARACVLPVGGVAGRAVLTLEGLSSLPGGGNAAQGDDGGPRAAPSLLLHPVQQAFVDAQAAQCGYCLNGMVMATVALLLRHPKPTEAQIRGALSHNLCRCGTHLEILAAVRLAAERCAVTAAGSPPQVLPSQRPAADGAASPAGAGPAP